MGSHLAWHQNLVVVLANDRNHVAQLRRELALRGRFQASATARRAQSQAGSVQGTGGHKVLVAARRASVARRRVRQRVKQRAVGWREEDLHAGALDERRTFRNHRRLAGRQVALAQRLPRVSQKVEGLW